MRHTTEEAWLYSNQPFYFDTWYMVLWYYTVLDKHTLSGYNNTAQDVDSHYITLHHTLCRNDVCASSAVINIWFCSPRLLISDIYVWLLENGWMGMDGKGGRGYAVIIWGGMGWKWRVATVPWCLMYPRMIIINKSHQIRFYLHLVGWITEL